MRAAPADTGGHRGLLLAASALYALLLRPRLLRWGATAAELAQSYPSDELISEGRVSSTMATTIQAPPSAVWPWLVQMGCDRAGFYSYDRLDNGGRPSARSIDPDWQDLEEGSRMLAVPDGSVWFDVARLEPERTLVLRSSLALPTMRHFDPRGPRPAAFSDSIWAFHLAPVGDGATRLVVRGIGVGRPRVLARTLDVLFWEPAHWIMQRRQFAGLRRRAELVTAVASPA